jgi:acetyltransferase
MSNLLNDPTPVLLTDRLSAPAAAGVLRAVGKGREDPPMASSAAPAPLTDRRLDSVFGLLRLRPLAPGDTPAHAAFLQALGERGRRLRAFSQPATDGGVQLRLVLAQASAAGGRDWLLGELCLSIDRGNVAAEFALAVRPALQGRGLGRLMLRCVLDLCLQRRVTLACGSVPAGSPAMLALAQRCGFQILRAADGSAQLALMLRPREVR